MTDLTMPQTNLTMPQTKIKIEKPASDFLKHLKSNSRILFSGKFGIGKTFFLKHFFEIQEMKEKYNVFHLTPVNYQIANNEDIFELIKYDILYHLFGFDWVNINDNEKFSKSLVVQSYLLNDGINIISKIMKCIPFYCVDKAGKAIKTLLDIKKNYTEYSNQINVNDENLLEDFRKQIEEKKGSIYEFDAISEFIYDNLTNCNNDIENKEKHKENVLIIDDLDRIDPEHIFRILNVFSAHIDITEDNNTNKFGFDKIIFVCDVENIRNIFAAKYGQQTDFSGYIDKFYSSVVFHFNNKTAISEFIREVMYIHSRKGQNKQINFLEFEINNIRDILFLLIEGNAINLRQIFENVETLKDKNQNIGDIGWWYFPGYTIIWACYRILGCQKNALIDAFEKATPPLNSNAISYYNDIAIELLPLVIDDIYNKKFDSFNQDYSFHKNEIDITFTLLRESHSVYAKFDKSIFVNYNTLHVLLVEALNKLDTKGFLN